MFWSMIINLFKPVTIIKEVVKEVPVPISLRDFETLEELDAWFDLHKELRMEPPNLCDDYSRESRKLAEIDGYFLSYCLVADGIAYQTQVMEKNVYHIANMAIVTSTEEVYYVDLAWNKLVKLCNFKLGGKY